MITLPRTSSTMLTTSGDTEYLVLFLRGKGFSLSALKRISGNLPRLNQEEIENLNRLIISNEIELVNKKLPNKQHPRTKQLHR